MSEEFKSNRNIVDGIRIYASDNSDKIERKIQQNASRIVDLCEVAFKDKSAYKVIFERVSDGSLKSDQAAHQIKETLEKDPAKLAALNGNGLVGKGREKAIAAATLLAKAVEQRAALQVTSDRYTELWQKSVAALKLSPEKLGDAVQQLKHDKEFSDATRDARVDPTFDDTLVMEIDRLGLRQDKSKQMDPKGMEFGEL